MQGMMTADPLLSTSAQGVSACSVLNNLKQDGLKTLPRIQVPTKRSHITVRLGSSSYAMRSMMVNRRWSGQTATREISQLDMSQTNTREEVKKETGSWIANRTKKVVSLLLRVCLTSSKYYCIRTTVLALSRVLCTCMGNCYISKSSSGSSSSISSAESGSYRIAPAVVAGLPEVKIKMT